MLRRRCPFDSLAYGDTQGDDEGFGARVPAGGAGIGKMKQRRADTILAVKATGDLAPGAVLVSR
jgi:hypothetical protein